MAGRNPLARRTQMFEVAIAAHEVRAGPKRTVAVPASTVNLGGRTAQSAKLDAIRAAHRAAGVPPWKPCIRESWRHISAVAYIKEDGA
jgi:hypothetical protein